MKNSGFVDAQVAGFEGSTPEVSFFWYHSLPPSMMGSSGSAQHRCCRRRLRSTPVNDGSASSGLVAIVDVGAARFHEVMVEEGGGRAVGVGSEEREGEGVGAATRRGPP